MAVARSVGRRPSKTQDQEESCIALSKLSAVVPPGPLDRLHTIPSIIPAPHAATTGTTVRQGRRAGGWAAESPAASRAHVEAGVAERVHRYDGWTWWVSLAGEPPVGAGKQAKAVTRNGSTAVVLG